ncbi:MAG: T9SS type A sorting domain-containing protein [Bdellovibrionota bacterium]
MKSSKCFWKSYLVLGVGIFWTCAEVFSASVYVVNSNLGAADPSVANCTFHDAVEQVNAGGGLVNGCTAMVSSSPYDGIVFDSFSFSVSGPVISMQLPAIISESVAIQGSIGNDRVIFEPASGAVFSDSMIKVLGTANQFLLQYAIVRDSFSPTIDGACLRVEGNPSLNQTASFSFVWFDHCVGKDGGALHVQDRSLSLGLSYFSLNVANGLGGAVYYRGDNVSLSATTFSSNQAWQGGAVDMEGLQPLVVDSTARIINCTFVNNVADQPIPTLSKGGHIHAQDVRVELFLTTMTDGNADQGESIYYVSSLPQYPLNTVLGGLDVYSSIVVSASGMAGDQNVFCQTTHPIFPPLCESRGYNVLATGSSSNYLPHPNDHLSTNLLLLSPLVDVSSFSIPIWARIPDPSSINVDGGECTSTPLLFFSAGSSFDQRNMMGLRHQNYPGVDHGSPDFCDAGAIELDAPLNLFGGCSEMYSEKNQQGAHVVLCCTNVGSVDDQDVMKKIMNMGLALAEQRCASSVARIQSFSRSESRYALCDGQEQVVYDVRARCESNQKSSLHVYPNPVSAHATFSVELHSAPQTQEKIMAISLVDLHGRSVQSWAVEGQSDPKRLNLSLSESMTAGTYTLVVHVGSKRLTAPIVVR